jgi:hypothetical protein
MSYADQTPGYRIETKEQALKWILDEIQNLEDWRARLDVACFNAGFGAGAQVGKIGELRREFRKFLVRHGSTLGTLVALHRLGQLSDEQYQAIRLRSTLTLTNLSRDLAD